MLGPTIKEYERCSFNCVTNGPPYCMAVRSMWKLQWFHGEVIFYNRMKFLPNPIRSVLKKITESSSWLSHIHTTLTASKIQTETSFEIRAYIKGCVGLNVSVSQIYIDFLKEEKVVQHLSSTLFARSL